MTEPSKEQIEAWMELAGFAGVDEPTARAFHAAYAAGRRARMEEAAKIVGSTNNYDNPMTAGDCVAAIRAAMEAA